jgi:hypothetical protein
VLSSNSATSGKWYWEINYQQGSGLGVGIANSTSINLDNFLGNTANAWSYYADNGQIRTGGSQQVYGNTFSPGDIINVALDLDNGEVWFGINGVWQNSGDPAARTNPAFTGLTGTFRAGMGDGTSSGIVIIETILSSPQELNYSIPTGFSAGLGS